MDLASALASALVRRAQRIQNYEDANILAIEYESGHIPDEGTLLGDLGGMIPLLARLYGVANHPAAASPVVSGTGSDVLEATAQAEGEQDVSSREDPKDDYDARLRVARQIVARRGQPAFRAALLEAYQGRCAITGSDAAAALEAAHLRPYRGPDSNTVTNGLLLRADIHTLLDLCLLAPDPETRKIVVSKQLAETSYGSLSGLQLAEPAAPWQRPSQETLEIVWQHFRETEDAL
jgi:HNH endonuclease